MSNQRIILHNKLCDILGSKNVYYQPPENLKIQYPAIIYSVSTIDVDYSDNKIYNKTRGYNVMYITNRVSDDMVDKILNLDKCMFNTEYVVDGLYHYVFTIYN